MNDLILAFPFLSSAIGLLLPLSALILFDPSPRRARRAGAIILTGLLAFSLALLGKIVSSPKLRIFDPLHAGWYAHGQPLLGIDLLSAGLIPLVLAMGLLVLYGTSRGELSSRRPGEILLSVTASLVVLLSFDLLVLAVGFLLGLIPLLAMARETKSPGRLVTGSLLASSLACIVAVIIIGRSDGGWATSLIELSASKKAQSPVALGFLLVCVLLRNGAFPFHSWVPALAERTSALLLGLFVAPQLGAFVLLRVGVSLFPEHFSGAFAWVGTVALIGTLYAALLGLVASNARRAFGWLVVSQSSLVLVGLECRNMPGLTGGLLHWLSAALSTTGLGVALGAVEARVGEVDLRRHYGLWGMAPLLGGTFLVSGLAVVGLPGTIGFAAEDLIVHGTLEYFPTAGLLIVLATAANGFLVLKMFMRIFGGPSPRGVVVSDLRGSRRFALVTLAITLIGLGIFPSFLVESRRVVSEQFLGPPTKGDLGGKSASGDHHAELAHEKAAVIAD